MAKNINEYKYSFFPQNCRPKALVDSATWFEDA